MTIPILANGDWHYLKSKYHEKLFIPNINYEKLKL